MKLTTTRCDIFCTVIDNYGDIGVAWRLARQLTREHALSVCLWVDDLHSFAHICPAIQAHLATQDVDGIRIRLWPVSFPAITTTDIADIVIEAFACNIPEPYIELMAQRTKTPIWINLEYLSAEDWILPCHTMHSPHPRLALQKTFFFPGFITGTGGLLCEKTLLQQRDAFLNNTQAQHDFWASLNVPAPTSNELRIFLFAYESPVAQLIDTWAQSTTPISVCIPAGGLAQQCQQAFADLTSTHQLQLFILPFIEQSQFDYLLWACDINFVRGEDSFVRAQWAAKPFVWQIYRQEEDAHFIKLNAFLTHYQQGLTLTEQTALQQFWQAWNSGENSAEYWPAFLAICPQLQSHNQQWLKNTQEIGDLCTNLMIYCQKYL